MGETITDSPIDKILYGRDRSASSLYSGPLGLMGTWEVARYLGVERSRIARWLGDIEEGKGSIEPPVARLKSGPFWRAEQIHRKAEQMFEADKGAAADSDEQLERWLASRRRRRGKRATAATAA